MAEDERRRKSGLGARIAAARGSTSQVDFAKLLGISKNTILRYENGHSEPNVGTILDICEATGVALNWIITGEGSMLPDKQSIYEPAKTSSHPPFLRQTHSAANIARVSSVQQIDIIKEYDKIVVPVWQNPDPALFDFVPMAEATLSAGGGRFVLSEEMQGYYAFRKDWLSRVASSTKNLVLMRVHGGSMDPTIQDGDTVMIDTGRRDIKEGMIYALRADSTIMIKRLSFRIGGRVLIISDNRQEYEPYEADSKDLHVIGQIIFFCRSFIPD